MVENLRDLLHYLRIEKEWCNRSEDAKESYRKKDDNCKEKIYEVIKDNAEYFSVNGNVYCNLNNIFYTIPVSVLRKNSPKEIYELRERVNKSATGVYAMYYDNQAKLCVTDKYGNPYIMLIYTYKNHIEFSIFKMNGQGCIYNFSEPIDAKEFSNEHLKEIDNLDTHVYEYYEKMIHDKDRYKEIKKYSNYITVETISIGYAHCVKEVTIDKDIPIQLEDNEVCKYADDWNYCFGGKLLGKSEGDTKFKYRVRINTD